MELIQEFKNYLLIQKRQPSKATVKNYVADVKKFITWCEQTQGHTFNPSLVTLPLIQAYKEAKIVEFTASSIDRHLSSLKKFFTFLKMEGKVANNPLDVQTHLKQAPIDPWHLKEFKDFLYVYNASHLTIKNYLIDIKQFFTWFEQTAVAEDSYLLSDRNLLQKINDRVLEEYATRLYKEGKFSGSSVNRKLSSLRKYLSWAHGQGLLAINAPTLPANMPASLLSELEENTNDSSLTTNAIRETQAQGEFSQTQSMVLEENKFARVERLEEPTDNQKREGQPSTNLAQGWQEGRYSRQDGLNKSEGALAGGNSLTGPQANKRDLSIAKQPTYSKIPPVRLFQKLTELASLGLDYTVVIPVAFVAAQLRHRLWILKGKPLLVSPTIKLPTRQLPYRVRVKNLSKSFYNPLAISIKHFPWQKKLFYHIQYTRPQWYRRYSSLAVSRYFNFAVLMIFCAMIGFGMYSTFFSSARKSPTLATGPVAPPRVLSFQGRLTDNNDNPITTANTHLRFAIYNSSSASGSALLWQEVDDVNPDTDGDFAAILGNNSTIPQSVFAQNNALWLGVTVENTAELAPRQQIATVAFATNAELLQGMAPITQGASGAQANANTVLVLDSAGNLNLGQVTSTIQSTTGQFILSGKTLTLTSTAGTNTNIELAPDGSGLIDLQKPVQNSTLNNNIPSAAGAVEIDDLLAVLATSSGQSAFTINQNGTGPLISASVSGTAKFTVDNSGNVTAAGNVTGSTLFTGNGSTYYINNGTSNLNSLTLAADLTVTGFVGSDLIPGGATGTWSLGNPTHEWKNVYAQSIFINGQALTQLFQRNAGVLSSLNIGDDLAVGGTSTASAKFQIFGLTGNATTTGTLTFAGGANNIIAARNNQGLTIGDAQTGNVNFNNVNVGINATLPLAKLDVRGSLSSIPVASISGNTSVPVLVVDNTGSGNLISAQQNGSQVFKVDNTGIAYAGQFVDFNNSSYFLDPAATGTSLKVAGGIGAGGASPSVFTIQSHGDVGPDANNAYDLGSLTQEWRNIYGQHVFSGGVEVTQLWQENLGALSPLHITDDLLLGATSTTSARFAVTNIAGGTPTASLSAGLNSGTYLTADGTLATRALQSLAIGSTSTGNINLGSDATARVIALGNTTGATGLTVRVGTGNYSLDGVAASTYSIGASAVAGTLTLGGTGETGTLTLGQSTAGQSINIGNSANSSSQQIQIANGASAANSEVDILSGTGTSGTSTLKLADNPRVGTIDLGNVATGVVRTITIAGGNDANSDTVNILAGNPSLGTQTVNILTGNATGGSQALNLGTGTSANTIAIGGTGANTLTIGNTQNGGSISLGNALTTGTISIGGTSSQTGSITIGDGTGNQIIDLGNGSGNKTINIGGTGTANTINIGSNQTAGKVSIGVASTLTTLMGSNFTSGGVAYATGSAMFFTNAGSSGQCLLSNGATAPTWGLCTFGNGNYWNLQNGALFPNNPTVDFLLGNSATTSAKFGVLNIASGTPTASVSSGLNGTAMSMDANGNLQTANKMTLTVGGSTTGNIVLKPQNGTSGTITFSGYSTGIIHSASGLLSSSAVDLQNDITGTLLVTHGGTGLASLASGSLIYGGGGSTATELTVGADNSILNVDSVTHLPKWTSSPTLSGLSVTGTTTLNIVAGTGSEIQPAGTSGTLNLGDGTHYYGTIYASNVVTPVGNGVSGFWQLNNNVISPVNNSYDFAVGGSATGSATPFQVFASTVGVNTAGTASTSGNLAFRGASTEIDLLNGTGLNIKSSIGGNAGLSSILNITNVGNVTIAGTAAINGNTISTTSTGTFTLLNTTINTLNFAQGTSNLTIGTGGTTNTTFNGNLSLGDSVSLRTITLGAKISSDILPNTDNSRSIGGAGSAWANIYTNNLFGNAVTGTSGYWQVNTNVISPAFNWQDLAIGGTASFSAKLQVFASQYTNDSTLNSGLISGGTASTSGGLTFKGGATLIDLLNNSTLGFYNSVGGDKGLNTSPELFLNNNGRIGIGTTSPLATLDLRGNSSSTPIASFSGTTSGAGFVVSNNGTGDYLDINNGGKTIAAFIQNGSLSHNAFAPGATDSYDLGSNPSSGGNEWDTIYVRQVITPSGALGSNYWQLTNNVIAPAQLFNDLAIGGAATSSATFHVFGASINQGTLAVASISAHTSFAGLVVNNTIGDLFTASSSGLNRFVITQNGSVGIGTTIPLSQSGLDIEKNALGNSAFAVNQLGLGDIFTASASGTPKLVVNNSGYLGLNTVNPQGILDVASLESTFPSDLTLGQSAGTNLIPNPSFEGPNAGSSLNTWFIPAGSGAQYGSTDVATESAVFGNRALKFYTMNSGSYAIYSGCIPVLQNTTYDISAYIYRVSGYSGNTSINWQEYSDQCATFVSAGPAASTATTNTWTRVSESFTTGASTKYIQVRAVNDGPSVGRAYFDGFQLEKGTVATPYIDGSLGPGYSWDRTGAPNATASSRLAGSAFAYNTINSASGLGAASRGLTPTLQLDQDGTGNIIAASASGLIQFKVDNSGIIYANSFVDLQNNAYMLDPANTGTSLTTAGSIGIGTTSPQNAIHAYGATPTLELQNTTTSASDLKIIPFTDGSIYFEANTNRAVSGNGANMYFTNNFAANTWLTILGSNGNVGIGTTNPAVQLAVVGAGQATFNPTTASSLGGTIELGDTGSSVGNGGAILFSAASEAWKFAEIKGYVTDASNNSTGKLVFATRHVTTDSTLTASMTIEGNGNVGIGTTTPNAKLTLSNNVLTGNIDAYSKYQLMLYDSGTADGSYGLAIEGSTLDFNSGSGAFKFYRGGSSVTMDMDTSGNVGIGTTTPGSILDINGGPIHISGNTSNAIGSGQGAYLSWNALNGGGTGETDFINHHGGGSGGWDWFDTGSGTFSNGQPSMSLTAGGQLSVGNSSATKHSIIAMYPNGLNNWFYIDNNNDNKLMFSHGANPRTTNDMAINSSGAVVCRGGCSTGTPDFGELIPVTDASIGAGDIITSTTSNDAIGQKSSSPYQENIIGAISAGPGFLTGINFDKDLNTTNAGDKALAVAGRIPVKVTTENGPIHAGDPITSSSTSGIGMKATKAGPIVGKALADWDPSTATQSSQLINGSWEVVNSPCSQSQASCYSVGKVLALINVSWYDPNVYLTTTGNFQIAPASPSADFIVPTYYTLSDVLGNPITRMGAFLELAVGNLRAGSIQAQQTITNTLAITTDNVSIAGQSLHDYIVSAVNQVLQTLPTNTTTSPIAEVDQIHTNLVSPLASDSAIMIDLHNSRIAVKNSTTGDTVASIDNAGNATFSGTLQSQNLAVNGDATISGTLHADKIEANSIAGLQAVVGTLSAQNITNVTNIYFATPSAGQNGENISTGSGTTSNNTYGLLTQSNGFADIASFSAYLSYIPNLKAATGMFEQGLISLGPTTLTDTSITGSLSIGSQMMLADNSINVLGGDLELQPLKQGGIAFVGGQVRIDPSGNLTVNGKSMFNGPLYASTISPLAGQDLTIQLGDATSSTSANPAPQLSVKNASGSGVFAINQLGDIMASGAANIAKLNFNFVQPAMAVSDTEVVATSSAGTASIKAYQTQLTIDNPNVTANSLIYITPVGNQAATPYLMRQVPGTSFTVGISVPSSKEVNFNWLIVN